jgi:TraC protein
LASQASVKPPTPTRSNTTGADPTVLTLEQVKKLYDRPPSFTNQLPWLEVNPEHEVVLLADGHSIGVAFELRPVSTEARPDAWLLTLRDKIQATLSSAVPEHDDPWILHMSRMKPGLID